MMSATVQGLDRASGILRTLAGAIEKAGGDPERDLGRIVWENDETAAKLGQIFAATVFQDRGEFSEPMTGRPLREVFTDLGEHQTGVKKALLPLLAEATREDPNRVMRGRAFQAAREFQISRDVRRLLVDIHLQPGCGGLNALLVLARAKLDQTGNRAGFNPFPGCRLEAGTLLLAPGSQFQHLGKQCVPGLWVLLDQTDLDRRNFLPDKLEIGAVPIDEVFSYRDIKATYVLTTSL